jgi:hypothetical protein
MSYQHQLRRGIASLWTSANPTLPEGVMGYETDTKKMKIGDGVTEWQELAYWYDDAAKQDTLVSGTTIKTINSESLLGSGDIEITGGGVSTGLVGSQGEQGFGVGVYPTVLPSGFTALAGYNDPADVNYGNYQTTNGSIMVFVPRFYYRFGHEDSPRYATYGANALDIVGVDTYASEAAANADGYAMHRAFKDGGQDKVGFFIDKYLASKDSNNLNICVSIANAHPISLTSDGNYTPSSNMAGCSGILADAVVLGRTRGTNFHCASAFQYSALALLSLAHGQASSNTTYCAWYDATHNFPKGCNNGALADINDSSVTYAVSYLAKPKTRATANFAKTTHNGQESGVADLNGSLGQILLGVTNYGLSGTDTTIYANGDAYVLKSSVAIASLTGGFNTGTDAWGSTTHLAAQYDAISGLFPWGSEQGYTYFGNGTNQVFSGDTSGINWLRTGLGIQKNTDATSVAGTNLFGSDGCDRYNRANLCIWGAGQWTENSTSGIFHRFWRFRRSFDGGTVCGFRCGFSAVDGQLP